jgi:hypothetical protein
MKKLYVTLMLAIICRMATAQISLTSSMAPPVNSMFIYYDANVPSPPFVFSTSGTTNTWDFSALTPAAGADDTVFVVDPSAYPAASAFTTATHATYEGGDDAVTMLSIDANGVSYLGVIGDPLATGTPHAIIANPPTSSMTFPYTYGSTASGTSAIDIWATGAQIGQPVDSVHYRTTMILDANVTASGTIIVPSGSFSCLQERRITTTVDSAWVKVLNQWSAAPGFPTIAIDSAYYWYSDQSLQHYAHVLYDAGTIDDVHYYETMLSTGISAVQKNDQLIAYPNPARDFLGVKGLDILPATEWKVYDVNGRVIDEGKSNLNQLNVRNFANGTYIIRLIQSNGQSSEIKFSKN